MDNKLLQVSLKYLYEHCTMFRCATRSFSKQGRFCGISALWWTLSSKTQESKVLQAKHFKVFLLATFKTTFWMENLTQKLKKKRGEASPSSSTPTCVIFFELIPSLVPYAWSKSWKYTLVWGAYPLLSLLSFACFEVSFRFLILSLQCRIDFVGPAASTETFILAQALWL